MKKKNNNPKKSSKNKKKKLKNNIAGPTFPTPPKRKRAGRIK